MLLAVAVVLARLRSWLGSVISCGRRDALCPSPCRRAAGPRGLAAAPKRAPGADPEAGHRVPRADLDPAGGAAAAQHHAHALRPRHAQHKRDAAKDRAAVGPCPVPSCPVSRVPCVAPSARCPEAPADEFAPRMRRPCGARSSGVPPARFPSRCALAARTPPPSLCAVASRPRRSARAPTRHVCRALR